MTALLKSFWNDRSGQGLVEYALIIALVSIAVIAALILLGGRIGNIFNRIGNTLEAYPALGGSGGS